MFDRLRDGVLPSRCTAVECCAASGCVRTAWRVWWVALCLCFLRLIGDGIGGDGISGIGDAGVHALGRMRAGVVRRRCPSDCSATGK